MLRLRSLGNLGLGNPGAMDITVVNDDNNKRLSERESVYMGLECACNACIRV